jgi:hypothetical protein
MSFIIFPGVITPPLTPGAVPYGTGSNVLMNAQGTAGQFLISGGGAPPAWASTVPGLPGAPFTAGAIVYGTGTTTAINAAGTTGQLLLSGGSGVPVWSSTFPGIPPAPLTAGGVVYGTGTGAAMSAAGTAGQILTSQGSSPPIWSSAGAGDVQGPSSATDNAIARFDATTGKLIQNSAATVADTTGTITNNGEYVAAGGSASTVAFGSTTGTTDTGMYFGAANTIQFSTAASERMRISDTGVVAISSTDTTSQQKFRLDGNGYGGGNGSGVNGSPNAQILWSGFGLDNSGSVNPVGFQLHGGGGGVPRGYILGTYGRGRVTGNDAMFCVSNTGNAPHDNVGPVAGVYRGSLDATTFAPNTTKWPLYYNNGGLTSFGVYDNYTGDYDGTSKCGVQVRLAGTYGGGSPSNWGGLCYTAYINTNFGSGSNGTNFGYFADITAAGSGNNWGVWISNGGAAKPGGGSWSSTSDARVKNVIGSYSRGLNDILQINPVYFTYNGKGGHAADGKEYIGVIAQEIEPVFPEMITRQLNKLNPEDEQDTELLMVDNSSLVYALVNSVKELKAEIESMKAELAARI